MKNILQMTMALVISFSLVCVHDIACAVSFNTEIFPPMGSQTWTPWSNSYNPKTVNGLVATMSDSGEAEYYRCDAYNRYCQYYHWSTAAAAYGSDTSTNGVGDPRLLGYAVEPMAEATGSMEWSASTVATDNCRASSSASASVNHRVLQRNIPDIPTAVQQALDAIITVPVRLSYNMEAYISNPGMWTSMAAADFSIKKGTIPYFSRRVCVGNVSDQTCSNQSRKSVRGTWRIILQRSDLANPVDYTISANAVINAVSCYSGNAETHAVADPFLFVDPDWEYAQYFTVLQESQLHPGEWVEITRLWQPLPPPPVSNAWWDITGSMTTPRDRHTATLLASGKVLVVGGYNGSSYVSSAELYDPAVGGWSPTGTMTGRRGIHTATLLQNGKVLIAGGYNNGALGSVEEYYPASGTWATKGSLAASRYRHTATLLQNGKVLVAGGYNGSVNISTAELYDPATGTWSPAGSMHSARHWHTATLLNNGKVLITGGYAGGIPLSSAELYDPSTGTWSTTGSMASSRQLHTATLLPNGKVLAAGGSDGVQLFSAELYDPVTGTWSMTGSMSASRFLQTATLLNNGKVLVTGGSSDGAWQSSAELFDPAIGGWLPAGYMNSTRLRHTGTLLPDGKVLATGGYDGNAQVASAEIYNPEEIVFTVTAAPAGGSYNAFQTVTLSASVPARIYYTTDGSDPLSSDSRGSFDTSGQLTIAAASATLKYYAVDADGNLSGVMAQNYTITPATLPDLTVLNIAWEKLGPTSYRLTIPVANPGDAATPAGTLTIRKNSSSGPVIAKIPVAALASHATVDYTFEWTAPTIEKAWYTVVATVDEANAILESNELNNSFQTILPGFCPDISVTPDHFSFGTVYFETPVSQTITIQNTGTAPLVLSSTTFTGLDPGYFVVSPSGDTPCPSLTPTLQSGQSCTLAIKISSTNPCFYCDLMSTLTVTSNDPDKPTFNVPFDISLIDNKPPILTLSTLTSGASTNNTVLNLAGTVTDPIGIYLFNINGREVPLSSDGSFSQAVRLGDGVNTINLFASDNANNLITETRTIILNQEVPLLAISSPVDNSANKLADVVVNGTTVSGASVAYTLNGGVPQTATLSGTAFSLPITLAVGLNTIEITATDGQGRKNSQKRTVWHDPQKLTLEITDLGQDGISAQQSYLLKGKVADSSGQVSVTITVDGQSYSPQTVNGLFEQQIPIHSGPFTLASVTATDAAGATATVTRNIRYEYQFGYTVMCGFDNGKILAQTAPMYLCSYGIPSNISGNGHPWSWTCQGEIGATIDTCSASIQTFSLSVTVPEVNGKGDVQATITSNDDPPVIILCPKSFCSAHYDYGIIVGLTATPEPISLFTSWEGDCLADPCDIEMNANKTVTANFTRDYNFKNVRTSELENSLDAAILTANPGDELRMLATELIINSLILDKTLTLSGGWKALHLSQAAVPTTLNGTLTIKEENPLVKNTKVKGKLSIQSGSLRVNGVIISP